MNNRAGSIQRLATPVRAWSQRFTLLLLVGLAVALMILSRTESVVIERARTSLVDVVSPILEFVSRPVATISAMVVQGGELVNLAAVNTALREQNERLAHWQTVARQLEADNAALRAVLNLAPEAGIGFVTGRVIGDLRVV